MRKMDETKKAISELIADKEIFKLAKEITVSEANRYRWMAGNALARLGNVSFEDEQKLKAAVFVADLIDAIEKDLVNMENEELLSIPKADPAGNGRFFEPILPGNAIQ